MFHSCLVKQFLGVLLFSFLQKDKIVLKYCNQTYPYMPLIFGVILIKCSNCFLIKVTLIINMTVISFY